MKFVAILFSFILLHTCRAQEVMVLFKEANSFERQFKEPEALEKYKLIINSDPHNIKALVKATELYISIGGRQNDKNTKRLYYESARAYAIKAFETDSSNADANYVMGISAGKMTDVSNENKKIVAYVKEAKIYNDKAIAINPSHAKAIYSIGKWHYEMVNLSGIKKIAVKLFYGGLPDASLDSAISYFEKAKTLDPYFPLDYLDLAKAYRENHRPAQAIEVLNKLIKLPTLCFDDFNIKAEGSKMLNEIQ